MSDRRDAAVALGRVLREGAWSNIVLRDGSGRARALLMESLRRLPLIDATIERASGRPTGRIDDALLDLLRIATTELDGRGDRPVAIIVDGAVRDAGSMTRRYRGFANAVLRRVAEQPPSNATPGGRDRGIPTWVYRGLGDHLGPDEFDTFWAALDRPAPVGIRSAVPVSGAEPVSGIPSAWLWSGGRPPDGVAIQDPASVAVVNALDVRPGMTVADIAAAPGGKTSHLVELAGPDGLVVAADVHRRRAATGSRRMPGAHWIVTDGRAPALRAAKFDRVLLDAPCSGLGTLRRRPEIRYRIRPEGVDRLAELQNAMLDQALGLLAPGGRLAYSVCTVLPQETSAVVDGRGGKAPKGLPGRPWGDGWLMSPDRGPTDGMFLWVFDAPGTDGGAE